MTAIAASLVKELRDLTGLGMMDCKKALVDADGDRERAIEILRTASGVKAAKKAGREASEGVVAVKIAENNEMAIIAEVNCETDFAARHEDFRSFVATVTEAAFTAPDSTVEQLLEAGLEEERQAIVQKIGENVSVRRSETVRADGGLVADYVHNGKIGVLVQLTGGSYELGRDIAMHIAASNPLVVMPDQLDQAALADERRIFEAQAAESGKSEEIAARMVEGRIKKYLNEVSLVNQPFVKDPQQTIGALLNSAGATVEGFVRFEVGGSL